MAEYQTSISSPNLSGLDVPFRASTAGVDGKAAVVQAVGQVLGLAANAYGRNKARAGGGR